MFELSGESKIKIDKVRLRTDRSNNHRVNKNWLLFRWS